MYRKIVLIAFVLSATIFAKTIEFEEMQNNPARVSPNSQNEILSFNNNIKDSVKSVVNISTKRSVTNSNLPFPMLDDPFFKKFFGDEFSNQFKQNRIQNSLGSGVIVTKDGYIVTNNHVIENAEEIAVTIADDQTEYSAKLIGKDADSDIAVIKIDTKNKLTPIKLGDSTSLLVGDLTFAIGDPFGVGTTVTMGIISALNKNRVGINKYENYIQTDASINPGNSGGALVDSRGALIGINTAILSKSGGNDGIGFAIPVDMVKDVVSKLVVDGKVTRGYLGVIIADLDKDTKQVYKKEGAIILDVAPNTPASQSGLKRGDLVFSINDKKVKDRTTLQNIIASFKPNEKVVFGIERDKKDIKLEIVLGDRSSIEGVSKDEQNILNGLKISPITNDIARKYRLPNDLTGVLIIEVEPKSKAEKAGFLAGDIIIQIEDIEIKDFSNIQTALKRYNDIYKKVYINRYGQTALVIIQ
ncbi:Periplasmic serine endoprotease DegP precursor [Aliarcobacter thereius]|uniref:Do family serine endopeptidase n=2 Tax=Aliarcobacter thereius TaxID=544718 RepID=A0A5R9H247_9BACT|nr:Do family serine endopeptidase [Aliarcobacter thereius]OCL87566.1 Periplasmic serine endoprotease DegP precursor [Aliarcobacter thereius]OCL93810.1 Periplasmic serine endoprotease DegP precursor [Aliarcobacter thereius]OCL95218.1 Periplasmic serine endoprotease DegP precursor [Aliarcobacter thereius LMG 24486]QBF16792.1 periplasmic heat shock serine protease HtrA, Do family [Aliarcobacter thereius LMG 24486]TLS73252.1 Do family serine endopeptidase [Aliarcobacter thereius]